MLIFKLKNVLKKRCSLLAITAHYLPQKKLCLHFQAFLEGPDSTHEKLHSAHILRQKVWEVSGVA